MTTDDSARQRDSSQQTGNDGPETAEQRFGSQSSDQQNAHPSKTPGQLQSHENHGENETTIVYIQEDQVENLDTNQRGKRTKKVEMRVPKPDAGKIFVDIVNNIAQDRGIQIPGSGTNVPLMPPPAGHRTQGVNDSDGSESGE
jgi:hypothetical protein